MKPNRIAAGSLLLFVIVFASAGAVARHGHGHADPVVKTTTSAAAKSDFSFIGTSGWRQGATNATSMALFHNTDGCFVSVQYKTGMVTASELSKELTSPTGNGGITPGAVIAASLQTDTGTQTYQLHQYTLAAVPGQSLMTGLEVGYLPMSGYYIKAEGHCDNSGQLPATLPALQAIKFSTGSQ